MEVEELLDALLGLDPHVRKVCVIRDLESRSIMKSRPDLVEVLLDKEDKLKIIFSIVIDSFRQFEGEAGVGTLHLTAIYYRDLYFFLFPYERYVVGVSCDPGSIEEITRKLLEFIKKVREEALPYLPERLIRSIKA